MTDDDDTRLDLFVLDQHNLDVEWVRQAKLFYIHAMRLASARQDHELAKSRREVVEAELDRDIRLQPKKFDLEKVTEAAVAKAIVLHDRYQLANVEVIRAKYKVDMLEAAVHGLEHKKKGLEKMVDLFLSNYWAEPKGSLQGRDKVKEMQRDAAFSPKKRERND